MKFAYRPEIDGLRAIAILAVLCFHLQILGMSGGFIGVDVFFVISGYLITRNIVKDLEGGNFSLKQFYLGRIRRLFPALLATIVATLATAYLVLTPEHLERLGHSAISAIFSVSNLFFWSESGYFDEAKVFKPLLHTWSLGVEEQFYLIWPLLLIVQVKYTNGVRTSIIIGLAIASFAVTQFIIEEHSDSAFYWMPLRAWEFAIGSVLVFQRHSLPERYAPNFFDSLAALIGLLLILIPIFTYDQYTLFPGLAALTPCLGTALLILYGNSAISKPLLTNRLTVYIGRLSYSLYLVHWPIIILFSYWKLGGIGLKSLVLVLPTIVLSAVLLNYFVEQRFRYPRQNHFYFFHRLGAVTIVTVALSYAMIIGNGWSWRYPDEAQEILHAVANLDDDATNRKALIREYQVAFESSDTIRHYIIGDSFAEGTFLALKSAFPQLNLRLLRISAECQPVLPGNYLTDLVTKGKAERCNRQRQRVFNDPGLITAKTIFIAASWREPSFSELDASLAHLQQYSDALLVIFGTRPSFHDVPTLAMKHGRRSGLDNFVDLYRASGLAEKNQILSQYTQNHGGTFVDLYQLICSDVCPILNPQTGKILYSDNAHWTMAGVKLASDKIKTYLQAREQDWLVDVLN
jgi:peptidoglycan/LPS O-acetylase OafA/YrhL